MPKENQRIRMTKKMLRESLVRLLAEKSIHKISVRELCEDAEINRSTFYTYYGSHYELLKDMENEVLFHIDGCLSDNGEHPDDVQWLTRIVSYLHENAALCRLLINNSVDSEFPERLLNLPVIRRLLGKQLGQYGGDASGYMYQFVVNGGFSMIKIWINRDDREPPETMAGLLISTVYKLLQG